MLTTIASTVKNLTRKQPILIEEEFINWLIFANAGMLNRGNLYCFDYAIKNLPSNNPLFEIGSFCGLSTNIMNYFLKKHGKKNKIITSDKWVFEGGEKNKKIGDSNIDFQGYSQFVKETYKRNVSFFGQENLPYTIEQFSDDFFKLWDKKEKVSDVFERPIELGGKISFAFIDGNHTYEYAKRDFENCAKNLDKGGFILFDDSADYYNFGCVELAKEVKNHSDFKLIIKNPNYLFQKIN